MSKNLNRLLEIMVRLRDPVRGCPWDVEQTFKTVAPFTIEEAYEVIDAINEGDLTALREELGDLLFQVVFHSRIAEEAGHFDFDAVAQTVSEKMVRRHPQVFGGETLTSLSVQMFEWETQKEKEREGNAIATGKKASALDGIAKILPALTYADKISHRAARIGFDWPDTKGVFSKIFEELDELQIAINADAAEQINEEIGDLLFTVCCLARHMSVDPESSLRAAILKFERRFREVEESYVREGLDMSNASLENMETRWQKTKNKENTN